MTRSSPRLLAFVALVAGLAAPAIAQDRPFQFSTHPDKLQDARQDIDVRPNTKEVRYLYLQNPAEEDRTYTVELRGPVGSALSAIGKVTFNKAADAATGGYARVTFTKPAPPPAPPAGATALPPAVPQPTPGAPVVKKAEPPPGVELIREPGELKLFQFTLRLFDETGKTPVLDTKKKRLEQAILVSVKKPTDYIGDPTVTTVVTGDTRQITAEVTTTDKFLGPTQCPVVLDLPRQPTLDPVKLGPGPYRRVLTAPKQTVQLQVKDVPFRAVEGEVFRFGLNVDGYPRAFAYRTDFGTLSKTDVLKTVNRPYVRIYPAQSPPDLPSYYVRPGASFPVRVELDGPLEGNATVQLRVDRNSDGKFDAADEITVLPGLRDEKIWIEPAHEGGAMLISSIVDDWVREIDTLSIQGEIAVIAAVVDAQGKVLEAKDTGPIASSLTLIVDNTPPERIDFSKLPEKHVKGTPLPLAIRVFDPERTPVKKAAFFIGKPTDEGKPPEGAALVPATVDPKNPTIWRAEMPLPADRKGEIFISVITETVVGFGAFATQRVLLVDAPLPAGTITGIVTLGGLPQEGVAVLVTDAEGKPKGATKTKAKGAFEIKGVPPGVYRVSSEKPDSVSKMAGSVPAEVKVGEITEVAIPLTRPKPPAR